MLKYLIVALTLGAFAMSGMVGQAQAQSQYKACIKAPKDNIPCPVTPQRPQLAKPRGR